MEFLSLDATITAAFVAGAASFVVTVLSKDQKTSEFRQAWIDELRKDSARLAAKADTMLAILSRGCSSDAERDEFLLSEKAEFSEMQNLVNLVRLRLNPTEHTELLGILCKFDGKGGTIDERLEAIEELVPAVQKVLKDEWERVKRGEPSFRFLKWIGITVPVAMASYYAISLVLRSLQGGNIPQF